MQPQAVQYTTPNIDADGALAHGRSTLLSHRAVVAPRRNWGRGTCFFQFHESLKPLSYTVMPAFNVRHILSGCLDNVS